MKPSTASQNDTCPPQLSKLLPMESPEAVLREVRHILHRIDPAFDTESVDAAFQAVTDLFQGDYPGYRACNTEFHDLNHTSSVFLAMARLIHGAVVEGEHFSRRQIVLGLMAALFHDSGYIQSQEDTTGTGAKYTPTHVERSMELFGAYARDRAFTDWDIAAVQSMILCTNLSVEIGTIAFPDRRSRFLGRLLGAADILAQMADRTYIEKLLFLYREFRESGLADYESELDLLRKTIGFYDFVEKRLSASLRGVDRFMLSHFRSRWDIAEDLYKTAIENQRCYLMEILEVPDDQVLGLLKRGGITRRIDGGPDACPEP